MNVFLVHGSFGKPFENWFPWIEEELTKRNVLCTVPSFPTPNNQNYEDWEKLMDYYCERGIVNSQTILIGHSCGSVFLVHYLATHNISVAGLITVSGYNDFYSGNKIMDSLNSSFYLDLKLNSIRKSVQRIISVYGDNDPNIPVEVLKGFADDIGAEAIEIPNAGHFNASAGYTKCNVVLDLINEFL